MTETVLSGQFRNVNPQPFHRCVESEISAYGVRNELRVDEKYDMYGVKHLCYIGSEQNTWPRKRELSS